MANFRFVGFLVLLSYPNCVAQSTWGAKGGAFTPRDEYLKIRKASNPVSGNLPHAATLERDFPAAMTQGNKLSCTAFACAYNKTYRIYKAAGRIGDPEQYLQSPAFIYSALSNGNCNSALHVPRALAFLKIIGSVPLKTLAYDPTECHDWRTFTEAARYNSFFAERLSAQNTSALKEIKNHIVFGDPIIAVLNACAEFEKPGNGYIGRALGPPESCGPHTVLIIGYDDDLRGGAVRILNSWGRTWGDDGKAWISYPLLLARLKEAYVDYGPAEATKEELDAVADLRQNLPPSGVPTVTPEVLLNALRSNIDPKLLAKFAPIEGEQVNVSIWSIWLALAPEYASQIDHVGYWFLHWTFKHNPQKSQQNSSVFLAQWRGYGCVDKAYLIAHLKNGQPIRVDFDFCKVIGSITPLPPKN